MGFKFKRIDLVGGSSDFPTGDNYSYRISRSRTVLKKAVEAIIACNCGWALDTARNASVTDFSDVPNLANDSDYPWPGLFLRNSTSGCKMFIAYFGGKNYALNAIIDDFDSHASPVVRSSLYQYGTTPAVMGLIVSIIPADSSSEFGSSFDSTFLPADATRLIGTSTYDTRSSSYGSTYAGNPNSGYIYSWGLYVSPYTICVVTAYTSSGVPYAMDVPYYAAGRIIGTLAHDTDTSAQAKYGTVIFREGRSSTSSGSSSPMSYTVEVAPSTNLHPIGIGSDMKSFDYVYHSFCSITDANGVWLNGTDGNTHGVGLYVVGIEQLSSYIFNSTGNNKSRWIPYSVASGSTNLTTYGVVDGDGFKGYLDTDLFRCGFGTYGQTFDNGNFVCVSATNHLLLGWDPTNDSLV